IALRRTRQMRLEEGAHVRKRQCADELVDHAAAAEQLDRRDAADLELLGQVLVLVGVDLDDLDVAGVLIGYLFEDRTQRAARAAPGSPEVHQYRLGRRGLEHLGGKVCRGDGRDAGTHAPPYWDAT